MSETEQQETEVVTGIIEGVTQKKSDTWQVGVKPDGSQYTKNLWTKDAELVKSLTEKFGQQGAFVCKASYWKNSEGAQVRSLWIASVGEEGDTAGVQNAQNATVAGAQADGMTPEKWDAKERRDLRSRAWAQTISLAVHTIRPEELKDENAIKETFVRLQIMQRKIYEDVAQSFAYPADQEDIPF